MFPSKTSAFPYFATTIMSKPVATFSPPGDFDAVALSISTGRALQVLLPWCRLHNSSELTFAGNIAAQAFAYVEAIDFSVTAAQTGFTVAQEAISLGEFIPNSTPDQHRSYLVGMLRLARDGRDNATKTLQKFRDVRKDVLALLEKVKPEHKTVPVMFEFSIHVRGQMTTKTSFGTLQDDLHDGIRDLEEFARNISAFATWWNWMKMEETAKETMTQEIQFNYDSLRTRGVIRKWEELKMQYVAYVDEISCIRDCYPIPEIKPENAKEHGGQDLEAGEDRHQDQLEVGEKQHHTPHAAVPIAQFGEPKEYVLRTLRSKTLDSLGLWSVRSRKGHSARGPDLTGSVLMDKHIPPADYLSATFAKAEDFGDRNDFLILDFQCHPSKGRRFTDITITWKFKAIHCGAFPPKVVDAAPRRSVGGWGDDEKRKLLGLDAPIQAPIGGASIGVKLHAEMETHKVVPHAMTMTGSIRGDPTDHCVWTVKENGSHATGIPPLFRIAVVLTNDGHFTTTLEVKGTIEGGWWWRPKVFHFEATRIVDVGKLKRELERDPQWRKRVRTMDGGVPDVDTFFSQPIVA